MIRVCKATGLMVGRGLHFNWCHGEAAGAGNPYNCVGVPATFRRHCTSGSKFRNHLPFQFEGTPLYPHAGRCWELIEKYKISLFYTAPTAIRTLMKFGKEVVQK